MKKKAYFFLLDGIFALVILIIGFLLISSNTSSINTDIPIGLLAENTMDLLSSARVDNLCTRACSCSNPKLEEICPFIKNTNQTILDLFGELYNDNNIDSATELFKNISQENDILRKDIFGVEFKVNNDLIYSQGGGRDITTDLVAVNKITFGFYEMPKTGEVEFWGPYVVSLDLWQK